jgi:hypothetical protein
MFPSLEVETWKLFIQRPRPGGLRLGRGAGKGASLGGQGPIGLSLPTRRFTSGSFQVHRWSGSGSQVHDLYIGREPVTLRVKIHFDPDLTL